MALTRKQLRARIIDQYSLPPELPDWLDVGWFNTQIGRGQREVAEATECIQGSAQTGGTAGARVYTIPADFIRIKSVWYGTTSARRELERVTRDELAYKEGTEWRNASGALSRWYVEDYRHIGLDPIPPTGSGATAWIFGPRYPAALSADGSSTEIPTALEDAVVDYVCRELASLDPSEQATTREGRFAARYERNILKSAMVRPHVQDLKFVGRRQ